MEVNFNRQTIISFPNNNQLPDITPTSEHGIVENSMSVDEVLFTDRFTVGSCNANKFEVELFTYPKVPKGEKIYVYQIVDEVEGQEPIEEPIFTGFVDTCTTERGRDEDVKKITAYDAFYEFGSQNVADWWADCFDNVTYVTVKYLRNSLFSRMGIPYENVTLPNDSETVVYTQKLSVISFSAVLNYIMLVNGANAKIDRSGTAHFFTLGSSTAIPIDNVYAENTTEFDTYTIPAYAGVRLTNSAKNIVVTVGENYNILDITDNLLLMKKTADSLRAIGENILNVIKNITYKPAQIDMIYSQLGIHVGDKVKIGVNEYLVCENTLSGSMLVDQHIASIGAKAFEEAPQTYNATQAEMQGEISASSLKYYRYTNRNSIEVLNNVSRQIISIRYSVTEATIVTFNGAVIIDVEIIDSTQPAVVEAKYMLGREFDEVFKPTETYFYFDQNTQRHTLNLLHFWEHSVIGADYFRVYLTCTNCNVTIGAFREEAILSGMGLVGENIWDGYIELEDEFEPITFRTTPQTITAMSDAVTTTTVTPYERELSSTYGEIEFNTMPTVLPWSANLLINKEPISNYTWGEVSEYTWDEVEDLFYW